MDGSVGSTTPLELTSSSSHSDLRSKSKGSSKTLKRPSSPPESKKAQTDNVQFDSITASSSMSSGLLTPPTSTLRPQRLSEPRRRPSKPKVNHAIDSSESIRIKIIEAENARLKDQLRQCLDFFQPKKGIEIYGVPLSTLVLEENLSVPRVIMAAGTYILEHGLSSVGIFENPGDFDELSEIEKKYLSYGFISFAGTNPLTAADFLKKFLSNLPTPVLSITCFDTMLLQGLWRIQLYKKTKTSFFLVLHS